MNSNTTPVSNLLYSHFDKRQRINREIAISQDKRVQYIDTYKIKSDNSVFQYVFANQCEIDFFGCRYVDAKFVINFMKCDIQWEEARFLIEKKHHLFDVQHKKTNLQGSYIQAYFWTPNLTNWRHEAKVVPRDHFLSSFNCLILIRKPLPYYMTSYVPNSYKHQVAQEERLLMTEEEQKHEKQINKFFEQMKTELWFTDDMTEEEKMDMLMKNTKDRESIELKRIQTLQRTKRKKIDAQVHAADLESDISIVNPPPPGYVCHRCMKRGHWKHMCHTLNDLNFIPPTVHKLPSGIPKRMLREATTDEERQRSMVTDTGKFVVMNHNYY